MPSIYRPVRADIFVKDAEGNPLLLAEVKMHTTGDQAVRQLEAMLSALPCPVPFAMVVDPHDIRVFTWDGRMLNGPIATIDAGKVFRHYTDLLDVLSGPELRAGLLETLTKGWLRDLDYRWKSKSAQLPGAEDLNSIGLLPRLKDSSVRAQVLINGNSLS
jgi:hypothetical protein